MAEKETNILGTIGKILTIIVIFTGLVSYIYSIGEATRVNTQNITRNTYAIEKIIFNNEDVKVKLNEIQINQKEQEVHLIYIRKLLDREVF